MLAPSLEQQRRLGEVGDASMRDAAVAAIGREPAFREDIVGAVRRAEVGAAITHDDTGAANGRCRLSAFAVSRGARAIGAGIGEAQLPAVPAEIVEPVSGNRQIRAGPGDDAAHDAVEPVRDDGHLELRRRTGLYEGQKSGIDMNARDEILDLAFARAHEVDLAGHAFARADALRFPLLLDLTPARLGEPFEKQVGGVLDRDRPVEIEQNLAWHPAILRHPYKKVSKIRANDILLSVQSV